MWLSGALGTSRENFGEVLAMKSLSRMDLWMTAPPIEKSEGKRTGDKAGSEPSWKVILHNDWENSMPKVVRVLVKVVPGMTIKRAIRVMWEAHTKGKAVVKRCHKELAELYEERLQKEGLTTSIEPDC